MSKKGIESILTFILIAGALVIGLGIGTLALNNGISESESSVLITDAVSNANAIKDLEISNLSEQINSLNSQLLELQIVKIENEVLDLGYLIDDLSLASPFSKVLSDRELKLFDGKIDFDGEEYDAEETFSLNDLEISINKEDFKENAYLQILEDGLFYRVEFESNLDTSEISDEETLEFDFLGQPIEISDWDVDEVTFFSGTEMFVEESEIVEFEGHTIVLISVSDESIYISISKDDVTESGIIKEDKTKTINGLEIKVEEVFASSYKSFATLIFGEDIEVNIIDGEEYSEDSIWEYVIDANSIGIVLKEDFKELEDREGFNVLDVGETLCLPNDYLCVQYNGIVDSELMDYDLEIDDGFLIVGGNFISGLNDYDKLFINGTEGLVYEDDEGTLISGDIFLGNSDLKLSYGVENIAIVDTITGDELVLIEFNSTDLVEVKVDISEILNGIEDNYRTRFGIIVENPKDSIEDNYLNIIVPEEKLEASISVL